MIAGTRWSAKRYLLFERMYIAGRLDTPGMGFIYVTPLEKADTNIPEDVAKKMAK